MSEGITPQDYADFRQFLLEESGIVLGENKQYLVTSRLRGLLAEMGLQSVRELLQRLRSGSDLRLRQRIIDSMTTHETLWFRDQYPFEALKRVVLPELAQRKLTNIRIWSAACASGQEPYSIGIICQEYRRENTKHTLGNVQIIATDISPTILKAAKEGVYESIALARGLTPDRRERYFDAMGDKAAVKPGIKQQVSFRELNLKHSFSSLGRFHIIFCRNVMIYFSDELKIDILNRLAAAMEPGGYLFLGGSEAVSRFSDKFEASRACGGMIFRLKSGS